MPSLVHPAIILALTLAPGLATEPGPWPRKFRGLPAKVISSEGPRDIPFAYETANFRIHSDAPLKPVNLTRFATVIESVPQLIRSLPLELHAPPDGDKPRIVLCKDSLSYHSQGGAVGTLGYYDVRHRCILIRADIFLRPPAINPTRLQPIPDEDLLVHETTHLVMHDILWRTPPWFYEGIAEYLSAAHTARGSYDFTRIDMAVRDHIRSRLEPDRHNSIPLTSLQEVTSTSGRQWLENGRRADGNEAYKPYASSLLLVHYHLRSAERRTAIANHLTAIRSSVGPRRPSLRMDPGNTTSIEETLAKYWTPKGIPIVFPRD